MPEQAQFRSVWAVFEMDRAVTIDDIAMIAEVDQATVASFIPGLMRNGFIDLTGIRTAGSGEALPVFKLTKRSHKPPYEAVDFDCTERARASASDLPTLKGWMRAVARTFGREFTRLELLEALPQHVKDEARPSQLKNAFANLRHYQYFERSDNGFTYWEPEPFPHIIDYVKSRPNMILIERDIEIALERKLSRTTIRQALDILATTGWIVEINIGKKVAYKAIPPRETK